MHTLFKGRYKILKELGSGGMGTVYLAENATLGTKWAIKAIARRDDSSYDLLAEPNILKKLNHPALPRIVDIEWDDEYLYIIEDYIEGEALDRQLDYKKSFDEATVVEWAKQICNILHYLHNQTPNPIIYRDMKPSNIIVSADNTVKIIDFGISREYKTDSGSDTSYMGTRGYAAPEQYGTSQTDARTDIYSLGVTMYHLLTGKSPNEPPYEFTPLRIVDKEFSEGIEYIVNKCVQNNPAERYQSAQELLHDLENIYTFNSIYKRMKLMANIKLVVLGTLMAASLVMCAVSASNIVREKNERYDKMDEAGYYYLNLHEYQTSLEYFKEAAKINNRTPEPYLGMAQILLKQGRCEECADYLNELAQKMPECSEKPQFSYLKGSVLYENQNYEEALGYLKDAYNKDCENTDYARDLAVCYAKCAQFDRAETILNSITKPDSKSDLLEYIKGQVVLAKGNTNEAISHFENVITATENEDLKFRSYMEISYIYKDMRHIDMQGSLSKQIDVLQRAVRDLKDEDNLIVTEAMAEAYFTAKNYDLSVQKFNRLLELGYERAYIYRNLAIIYEQTGKLTEAEKQLLIMKEKYPDDYRCYLQLSYVYIEMENAKAENGRNYSKALENYNLAVQFAPSGENTSEILQLTAKINELKSYGWL